MPPDPEKAGLFSDINPHRHAIQRRKFSSFYSMTSLIAYGPAVNNCISLISSRFAELANAERVVNLHHYLQCYAFDVIGEITFGKRFGFLDLGEDKEGLFKAIDQRNAYGTFTGIFPWLHRWLFPWLPKSGGHVYVGNWTLQQIAAKKKTMRDPKLSDDDGAPDFMAKVLAAHEADPEKMTYGDLAAICISNIGAGSDTTAISLSSVLYHLMKHPESYRKLQAEIDIAAKEGRISNPITFKEAQDLRYLQAVIKEALRTHPATGLPLQRVVPTSTQLTIADYVIPPGSSVGINPWVAHQNVSIFGEDASQFRPERWIEYEDQGRGGEVERYFLAFGLGSRTCVGKNISLLEMSKLIPQMLREFDFSLDGSAKERVDGEGRVLGLNSESRWFVKQKGFMARVSRRHGK
jgi:cytochrome P450